MNEYQRMKKQRDEYKKLIKEVRDDLLLRAEVDNEGCKVVNLSGGLWARLKETLAH